MWPRLQLLKELLGLRGLLFISIDENEISNLLLNVMRYLVEIIGLRLSSGKKAMVVEQRRSTSLRLTNMLRVMRAI
jgi:hypothetical protein